MSVEILQKILEILETNFPTKEDTDAYHTGTYTAPAGTTTTITMRISKGWRVRIKHFYADAVADCSYIWYAKGWTVEGNEYEFTRGFNLEQLETIILQITNTGTVDQSIDVFVKGWGRKIG